MSTSAEQRIKKLRDELNHHNHLYYIESKPEISDREFDRLLQELIDLEKAHPEFKSPDSPTQRVGGDVQSELRQVRHAVPMMSIDNTYNEAEVRAFDERVRKALGRTPAYVLEPKIDGASINLRYENGQLVLAATRGRGDVGEDVTVNARTIRSVPLSLRRDHATVKPPEILEIRGEVFMDNDDFQRVNKEIEAEGEEPYANPRNLTSGTMRRLDPRIVAKRRLRFLAHGLGEVEPMPAQTYWEWASLLRDWGIPLPKQMWRVEGIDEALKCIHEFEAVRAKLPYMTDGMVMKVDAFDDRETLGATSKSPRWVIAYKYETEQQPTVLRDVRWQVGRTGQLTPVGILDPVFISGVTVSNVSLHNLDQIQRLDLHFGDTVVIERSGEVIPYVVDVMKDKRPKNAESVAAPENCPVCSTQLVREALPEEQATYRCINKACEAHYKRKKVKPSNLPEYCLKCGQPIQVLDAGIEILCPNVSCPGRVKESIRYFCARTQMDIEGLGDVIVNQLVDRGRVQSFADIFGLQVNELAELTHETVLGEKKAKALIDSIQHARSKWPEYKPALNNLFGSRDLKEQLLWLANPKRLGLKGLGEKTIEQLMHSALLKTAEDIFRLKGDRVANLPQTVRLGEKAAEAIVKQINEAKTRGLSRVLTALGIPGVGSTVARNLAEWAGNIDTLMDASVDELAAALAKNPDAKKAQVEIEKSYANALYASLHSPGQGLFGNENERALLQESGATADYLTARDDLFPKGERLNRRIDKLARCFPQIAELHAATEEQLLDCLLEGAVVARSLFTYLHSAAGAKNVDELKRQGVNLSENRGRKNDSKWTGKTYVITGSFEGISREMIKTRLLSFGAHVSESVSSKTHGIFVGRDPGSKFQKAESLGIPILGDVDVRELMKESS